jgi:predicted enzyme related to lactoylglutathione lyase
MNPVTHFEMPYDDPGRLATFYKAAFGWKMKNLGEKMQDYVLAGTTESTADGTPKVPGRINGGFFPRKQGWPDQSPSVVIAVGDIKKSIEKVTSAGGIVLGDPMDIPGIGAYVSFKDSEGNRVGMLEPLPMMKEKKKAVAKKKVVGKKKGKAVARKSRR